MDVRTIRRRTRWALCAVVAVACIALPGCGGKPPPPAVRSVQRVLNDLLGLFPEQGLDDVIRGTSDDVDDVFRTNRATVDDAFKVPAFADAVNTAVATADVEVRSLASRFEPKFQAAVEKKLRTMVCEARLWAQNQGGDVEIFRPWITEQFATIDVYLTDVGLEDVANWFTDKLSDATSTYSLACMAWVRASSS